MDWLRNLKSWSEVRRFLVVMVPVIGGTWFTVDTIYDRKLEENTHDVAIEQSIVALEGSVKSLSGEIRTLNGNQVVYNNKVDEFILQDVARTDALEKQMIANHNSFLFSIENDGQITRSIMLDMIEKISNTEKKTLGQQSHPTPPGPLQYPHLAMMDTLETRLPFH